MMRGMEPFLVLNRTISSKSVAPSQSSLDPKCRVSVDAVQKDETYKSFLMFEIHSDRSSSTIEVELPVCVHQTASHSHTHEHTHTQV